MAHDSKRCARRQPLATPEGRGVQFLRRLFRSLRSAAVLAAWAAGAALAPGAPGSAVPTPSPTLADTVEDPAPPASRSLAGEWTEPIAFPTIPIHATLLPTGQVLFWDRHDLPGGDGHPRLWDPSTGLFSKAPAPPPGHDLFCSGHTLLADGRLFVAGGHFADGVGQPFVAIYDPFQPSWAMAPEMNAGRWYPTATTLADGSVLVMAGSDEQAGANRLPQVFHPASLEWRDLSEAERLLPYYPFVFQAPDGRGFVAGPAPNAVMLDPVGEGDWSPLADSGHGYRSQGSAVLYGEGKVLLAGGGDPPTAAMQAIDLTQAQPAFRELQPMAAARRHLNLTLLPDGTVLATGGSSAAGFNNSTGAVLAPELWDPATETWTTLAAMAVPRLYHSVALLLPDGRVLAAGGGHPRDSEHDDPNHFDGQLFSPPYLFRGPRPSILSAPGAVHYGERFAPLFAPETAVTEITWVRLGSVTHGFDMNQRFLRLAVTPAAQGLAVSAPADPRLAPPGHYLMFALTADGVPSQGRVIRLDSGLFRDGFEGGASSAWSETVGEPDDPDDSGTASPQPGQKTAGRL